MIRAIALFRLAKAMLLIVAGFEALQMLRPEVAARVQAWAEALPLAGQHFLKSLITTSPSRLELAAAASFAYAALFVTEGVGLWLEKRWAEYLTIIATSSFIPFELWEVIKKMTAFRSAILIANVAIVIYLVQRRWRARNDKGAVSASAHIST